MRRGGRQRLNPMYAFSSKINYFIPPAWSYFTFFFYVCSGRVMDLKKDYILCLSANDEKMEDPREIFASFLPLPVLLLSLDGS